MSKLKPIARYTLLGTATVLADASTPEMIAQNAVAGVLGLTIPMIGNMFAKIADIYMSTGRKWDN